MTTETLRAHEVGAPRWLSFFKRILIIVAAFAIFLLLVRSVANDPPQKGPKGSSLATVNGGVAALADLAIANNYPVSRRTTPLEEAAVFDRYPLDSESVLVALNVDLSDEAVGDLKQFVGNGGHLVASVDRPGSWTSLIVDAVELNDTFANIDEPDGSGDTTGNAAVNESAGFTAKRLRVTGTKSFRVRTENPSMIPTEVLASRDEQPIAVTVGLGDGQMTLVSDPSMLTNALLDKADNAAFALGVLGNGSRRIVFAEEPHGFGSSITPTGLPKNVRHFLWGLVAATLLLMLTRGKRNGPPERAHRELAPPRSLYLASMAASLDKLERRRTRKARGNSVASNPLPHPDSVTLDQPETR